MEKIICLRFTDIFQGREDVRMELEKKRGDTYRKELEENEELKRQLTAKNRCDHNEQSPNKDGKFIVFKRFQRTSIKSFWFYQWLSVFRWRFDSLFIHEIDRSERGSSQTMLDKSISDS